MKRLANIHPAESDSRSGRDLPVSASVRRLNAWILSGIAVAVALFGWFVADGYDGGALFVAAVVLAIFCGPLIWFMLTVRRNVAALNRIYQSVEPVPMIWADTSIFGSKQRGGRVFNVTLLALDSAGSVERQYFVPVSFTTLINTNRLDADSPIFPKGERVMVYLYPPNHEPAIIEGSNAVFTVDGYDETSSTVVTAGVNVISYRSSGGR